MTALTVCAAAIPDTIKLSVKRHGGWSEAERLWVALVGLPSTKKTPITNATARPLLDIDAELFERYSDAKQHWDALETKERKKCRGPYTPASVSVTLPSRPHRKSCATARMACCVCATSCRDGSAPWKSTADTVAPPVIAASGCNPITAARKRPSDPPWWRVNPQAHRLFEARADRERERRRREREIIAENIRKQNRTTGD
jgi:hypothetical protein